MEQLVVRARTRLREGRALAGLGGRPARLVLRLDDLDAPGPIPAELLKLEDWYDIVVRVVEWSGPLPVHLVARSEHPFLAEMVRFAHRLECPTTLRTTAAGISPRRADELVDCGLERIVVRVAGVNEATQRAVVGESVADTRRAIAALLAARVSRAAPLDIVLEVPFDARTAPELRALCEEARTVGVDGVRVAAPWAGGPFESGALDALGWVAKQDRPFRRTSADTLGAVREMRGDGPGTPRKGGACPVGTLRVEILPDGTLLSCPFKGDRTRMLSRDPSGAMALAWKALEKHRDAIRTCDRACAHPELTA
ncbi:MAG: hypothetical protein Q8P18_10030 [Pseudomonadota bacterium]|nr:hypothetical protein [Pseudomonadota bacterium]